MDILILVSIFASFLLTFLLIPIWIKKSHENGFVSKDVHKEGDKNVADAGGVPVLFGISLGLLLYVALQTFYLHSEEYTIFILATALVVVFSAMVGMIDDLLGWKKGLSRRSRLILMIFAAIPLMVVNAGESSIILPLIGQLNLGLLFPLIFIPIGIVGATTTFNFLAGYNGIETSQGAIILLGLGIATYLTGSSWLSVVALYGVASLLAFYIFNRKPAKIFPGDILTYSVGAMIAAIAILGNIEKIALVFFIPYIVETILKLRGKLNKESFAKLNSDGSLDEAHKKIYGLEHLAIRILKKMKRSQKVYEQEVVYFVNSLQVFFILVGISLL